MKKANKISQPLPEMSVVNEPTAIEAATTEVLETLATFDRFEQNKIIANVLEAHLAERKLDIKRTKDQAYVALGSYEELSSIIKNQSI